MLVSSSNWKYQLYPLLPYFSVVVCLRCLLHHILSLIAYTFRGNLDFGFIIIEQFIMNANSLMRFGLQIVLVCLYMTPSHYHHCANLSEDIELIKCLSDIFCGVREQDLAYSLGYPLYNTWGISLVMIERKYTLSYHHHQIGSMNYNPLFRVRSRNNGMRSMSLMDTNSEGMNECERWSTIWKLLIGFANG